MNTRGSAILNLALLKKNEEDEKKRPKFELDPGQSASATGDIKTEGGATATPDHAILELHQEQSTSTTEQQVPCRCGKQQTSQNFPVCDQICGKISSCRLHSCREICCTSVVHRCFRTCNQVLPVCGHHCLAICHRGQCPPCSHVSPTCITCYCGARTNQRPNRCGISISCLKLCDRDHGCSHPVTHKCHNGWQCPPCIYPVYNADCVGKHKDGVRRKPCHLAKISCTLKCRKQLDCGNRTHLCKRRCHEGQCSASRVCVEVCGKELPFCNHFCPANCHDGDCDNQCNGTDSISCACGNVQKNFQCVENPEVKWVICDETCENAQWIVIEDLKMMSPDSVETPNTEYLELIDRCSTLLRYDIKESYTRLVNCSLISEDESNIMTFPPTNDQENEMICKLAKYYGCIALSHGNAEQRYVKATAHKDECFLPEETIFKLCGNESGNK